MLPHVILHNAVSLDGRITGFMPDTGLFYELAGKWPFEAHLAGSNTILQSPDNVPEEDENAFEPVAAASDDSRSLLVVPDSRGRIRHWHALKASGHWSGFVALCSNATPAPYLDYLEKRHIDAVVTGDDHVDLKSALEKLNERYDVKTVFLDGGGVLNGHMLRAGLVDEISVLLHPALVGGSETVTLFNTPELPSPDNPIDLELKHLERMADDILWLRYDVMKA